MSSGVIWTYCDVGVLGVGDSIGFKVVIGDCGSCEECGGLVGVVGSLILGNLSSRRSFFILYGSYSVTY